MTGRREHVRILADDALDAFWEVVARAYPQARSGELSIDRTIRLGLIAKQAIGEWIDNNVTPEPDAP